MHDHSLKAADIREACNVTKSTVYRWLNGDSEPTGKARVALADLLHTDWDFSLDQGDEISSPVIQPGRVVLIFDWEAMIVHSEPFFHPIFRRNITGEYLYNVLPEVSRTATDIFERSLRRSVGFEICGRYGDLVRVSFIWMHPIPRKKLFRLEEEWYEQFTLN